EIIIRASVAIDESLNVLWELVSCGAGHWRGRSRPRSSPGLAVSAAARGVLSLRSARRERKPRQWRRPKTSRPVAAQAALAIQYRRLARCWVTVRCFLWKRLVELGAGQQVNLPPFEKSVPRLCPGERKAPMASAFQRPLGFRQSLPHILRRIFAAAPRLALDAAEEEERLMTRRKRWSYWSPAAIVREAIGDLTGWPTKA